MNNAKISGLQLFDMFLPEGEPFVVCFRHPEIDEYICWAINEQLPDNHIKLWFIYTRPHYRGCGHASRLLNLLKDKHVSIETNAELLTDEGAKLMVKNGFKHKKEGNVIRFTWKKRGIKLGGKKRRT